MLVLVADDGEDLRQLMKLLVGMLGHEVVVASNGLQAVQLASRYPPDIILMDLKMPVMDGLTAVRTLRELAGTCRIPIVAVSALLGDDDTREEALAAGCNECHPKPLDFESLGNILARFQPPHDQPLTA